MTRVLNRPVRITVCCDGFVSIMETVKDRRLNAALPCHSAWTVAEAVALVARVCELRPCRHGGKTGTLLEPRAPNWPANGDVGNHIEFIDELAKLFQDAEVKRD